MKKEHEIMGLWLIMDDADNKDIMVSREYIKEKLKRICQGTMNFHPSIKECLTEENYQKWLQ